MILSNRAGGNNPAIATAIIAANPTYRAGLRAILETADDIEIIAEAASYQHIRHILHDLDVLLVVYSGEDMSRIPSVEIDGSGPSLLYIVGDIDDISGIGEGDGPIYGIVGAEVNAEELLSAVRALSLGLAVGEPHLLRLAYTFNPSDAPVNPPNPLTVREREVLSLLAQGLANKEISRELDISENTVKFHASSIYEKLGAVNRAQAVARGIELALISI